MIAAFVGNNETIIVKLNANSNPIDEDGTLFGPHSGRSIEDFERYLVDINKGQTLHLYHTPGVRVR